MGLGGGLATPSLPSFGGLACCSMPSRGACCPPRTATVHLSGHCSGGHFWAPGYLWTVSIVWAVDWSAAGQMALEVAPVAALGVAFHESSCEH